MTRQEVFQGICFLESNKRESPLGLGRLKINKDMKKQYVIARYWRGSYVETMCEPTTKKDADKRCAKLQEKEDPLNEYKVLKIPTTNKKVTYV